MDTIALRLAGEAVESFIGYLSGYVVELSVVGTDAAATDEPLVVMVDGVGRTDQGFVAIEVRAYDEDRLGATGDPIVVDFDSVTEITVF